MGSLDRPFRPDSWVRASRVVVIVVVVAAAACGADATVPESADGSAGAPGDSSPDDGRRGDAGQDGSGLDAGRGDGGQGGGVDAARGDGARDGGEIDAGRDATLASPCDGSVHSAASPGTVAMAPALTVPAGFKLEWLAAVSGARELAALPNGDLLVATSGSSVFLVANAEASGAANAAVAFTTVPDPLAQGVAFDPSSCTIYVGGSGGIYSMSYVDAQRSATASPIASVRTGIVTPNSDGDVHRTTSVAFAAGKLYAGVGSSCNACVEVDPTRSTIQELSPSGANMTTRATRLRNAIALATNPATGTLWAGGAGQDGLPLGHPYEFFDAVTLHPGVADYGWPDCEENRVAYTAGAGCSSTVAPLVELPAYSTLIGAVFYPSAQAGAHAFPSAYRGGLFLSAHGSWHTSGGGFYSAPRVVYVPMNGDTPQIPVNWSDPTRQWTEFVGGFELANRTTRIGRPSGIAVGSQGSLFVADDLNGYVYRIRPM
jgi:glucose/arabinose dehydrogenase